MKNVLLVFALVLASTSVFAEVVPFVEDTLQEVVVNARVEAQQQSVSIPSSIKLTRIEHEQRNAIKEISAVVPNLYIPSYGSRMTSSIYLRGLGARIDNPVVGVYVDGIGLSNKNSYDFALYDVRSLHVYRGPQGTLFGRNTVGGVVLLQTLSPLDFQGVRASAGYGNYNTVEAKASYYHKISKEYGVSASAAYNHTDGYFTNIYDGSAADRSDEAGVRLRFDARKENGVNANAIVSYNFVEQTGFPYHLQGNQVNHNDFCGYRRHNLMAASSYSVPVGSLVLSGTTSYQYLDDRMQMDQDYLPLSYFTLVQAQKEHAVSQELTLRPDKKEKKSYEWLLGVQVGYKHNKMTAPVTFLRDGIDSLILKNANQAFVHSKIQIRESEFVLQSDFLTNSLDVALYHTSYYRFGDFLLEGGLRLDLEYLDFKYDSQTSLGARFHKVDNSADEPYVTINSQKIGSNSLTYFEVLPRIALSYNRPLWKVYLSIAEGYKAGGFNTQLFSDILQKQLTEDMLGTKDTEYKVNDVITYRPERCLNFEIGAAAHKQFDELLLEGVFTVYEIEVFNQQQTVFPKYGTGRYMTNAAHSRSAGCELTGALRWKQLSFDASYGFTYAYFTNYDNGRQNFAGKRVPYAPQNTLAAGITYKIPFASKFFHSLELNINTTAVGKIYWNEENTEIQPFYGLLNANLHLQMKYVALELWGKNLTNTRYDVFRFVSMGNTFMQTGAPLTFGGKILVEI